MSTPALAFEPTIPMTREEYRTWAQRQKGRFERINGVVVAMAPERAGHNDRKMATWLALRQAVRNAQLSCHVYGDGMTVQIDNSDYEPDVVVRCGLELPLDAVAIPDPLIVVEVLSPSTSATDRAWKLQEYFRLPSVRHYLIVWVDERQIAHHERSGSGKIVTSICTAGEIRLDPPGINVTVEEIYDA